MSYTNIEFVKNHLELPYPVSDNLYDQPVIIKDENYIPFFGGVVDKTTLVVKSIQSNQPTKAELTFAENSISFSSLPVVRGSVLVANNQSLGTIYKENLDYIIDYRLGTVSIKEEGLLLLGQSVAVFYIVYHLYQLNSDYRLDSTGGQIQRVASGSIAVGETVNLDYQPLFVTFSDEVLKSAVNEANSIVEKTVDPNRQFEADPVLVATATYRAMDIVCRSAAARELTSLAKDDRIALAWIKLAESYRRESDQLMRDFKEPLTEVSRPTLG